MLCLGIIGCSTPRGPEISDQGGSNAFNTDISEINISGTSSRSFRVGVLLPLTGKASKHGQGLRNATMVALEDVRNPNLVLQYYDTQSTPSGARIAAENAIRQNSDLIIGPLMSTEVQAISNETIYQGVPVIAFSTAQEVLQPTVYTLGLLIEEQVNRIMTYAAQKGANALLCCCRTTLPEARLPKLRSNPLRKRRRSNCHRFLRSEHF